MCLLPHAVIFEAPVEKKQAAIPASTRATASTRGGPTIPVVVNPKSQALNSKQVQNSNVQALKPVITKKITTQSTVKSTPTPKIIVKPTTEVGPAFASDVIFPHPPDKPNLIAGITLDKAGKILSGVIVEIRDKQNLPVRAFKSNKLGQFFIATPLSDGIYQIQAEQDNQKFAIIKLEAKGEIIPPLKIQAIA